MFVDCCGFFCLQVPVSWTSVYWVKPAAWQMQLANTMRWDYDSSSLVECGGSFLNLGAHTVMRHSDQSVATQAHTQHPSYDHHATVALLSVHFMVRQLRPLSVLNYHCWPHEASRFGDDPSKSSDHSSESSTSLHLSISPTSNTLTTRTNCTLIFMSEFNMCRYCEWS